MAHPNKHVDELLKLSRDERSEAAEALLESLEDDAPDPDAEAAWVAEIEQRVTSSEPGIPAEQVFREARDRLRRA